MTKDRQPVDPVPQLAGSTAVLLCRGPSFDQHDRLATLGLPVMALNGYDAEKVEPDFWLCMDPLAHFEDSIKHNKAVKFIPAAYRGDYPNAYYYRTDCRGGNPGEFFEGHWVDVGHDILSGGMRSVMLPAFRLLYEMGARVVLLLGCDFPAGGYAHDPAYYDKLRLVLDGLAPAFEREGLRVLNCNPHSNLTTFPRMTLDEALTRSIEHEFVSQP